MWRRSSGGECGGAARGGEGRSSGRRMWRRSSGRRRRQLGEEKVAAQLEEEKVAAQLGEEKVAQLGEEKVAAQLVGGEGGGAARGGEGGGAAWGGECGGAARGIEGGGAARGEEGDGAACSSRCPNGDYCSNRRFQRKQHADVECILTDKKGWGLRAGRDLKPNTFVLEYCGEVLDHKEFKGRVKEYARSKNIHYYFMALKNDEIIDATQKGNCSRFMNHSCDPNCETQKWTVNGQVRVGFFTTRLVPAGAELTFDYQFQRYGKEAQKCFCGSANCRGYLGGENRVSVRAAGGKMKKERSRKKDSVDGELEALLENGEGLSDKNQVLSLSRLMVRIETLEQKQTCLKLIRNTQSQSCLKLFLECHGLSLLWIWMAELGDNRGNTSTSIRLQLERFTPVP
ncbi:unnamed protein product [Ranitomeya imitator]|uniref:Uncharacterized protein n=1 Tax=Ranitomeya imitator TaxID=111125 RepID=A0ABN9MAE4_9NEOB|nr:unnamed protein product [Ranitomeya imitator]